MYKAVGYQMSRHRVVLVHLLKIQENQIFARIAHTRQHLVVGTVETEHKPSTPHRFSHERIRIEN